MTEPTRINPADIRVGDRVERVYVSGDHETIERFTVESVAHRAVSSCRLTWDIEAPRVGTAEWYLLDRPDPDAALIERVVAEIDGFRFESTTEADARAVLAAIRETHDITPKVGE